MKNYFFLSLFFLLAHIAYTQEARFGFTVSPTFSTPNIEPGNVTDSETYVDDANSKSGIVYGILLDYDFNGEERYFLHSGLTLHHTGYDFDVTPGFGGGAGVEYEINTSYLEIPLSLKLKTNQIGYLRYYGQFGFNNGIKVGQKINNPEGVGENEINEFKSFNVGLNMGAGVEYNISDQTDAVAGIYYNNGLSKVIDSSAGSMKQNQLGIRLGVYF